MDYVKEQRDRELPKWPSELKLIATCGARPVRPLHFQLSKCPAVHTDGYGRPVCVHLRHVLERRFNTTGRFFLRRLFAHQKNPSLRIGCRRYSH